MSFRIVPMTAAHLPQIAALEKVCFPADPWSENLFRDALDSPRTAVLTAEDEGGAVLGYAVVFFGLILLMCVVVIMGKVMVSRANSAKAASAASPAPAAAAPAAPAAPSAPPAPGSAGEVKLFDVPDKEAAMIMAIVADKMGKPLNELRFKSIKEVK